MKYLHTLYGWYGRKSVIVATAVVIILIIIGFRSGSDTVEELSERLPAVRLASATDNADATSLRLVGTVRSSSEVEIVPERGGRVVSVPVRLGGAVRAGDVLFTLENSTERAAVLQAEGAYDAAVANASLSTISVREAEVQFVDAQNSLGSAVQGAYTALTNTIYGTVDTFYSNPRGSYPGVRIETLVSSDVLRNERVALEDVLTTWQSGNNAAAVASAKDALTRTLFIIDTFTTALTDTKNTVRFTDTERISLGQALTLARQSLVGAQTSIQSAEQRVRSAEETKIRAAQSTTGGTASLADAQVKQASGVLAQARANLAKTIVRSPISGTINSIDVSVGDTISAAASVLAVANNQQLEIVTYVSEAERALITLGDTVSLDSVATGTIAVIAPAVDPASGKIEVRIVTTDATVLNGTTVRLLLNTAAPAADVNTPIEIPLTAVKLSGENGSIFVVTPENTLEARPVTLGAVRSGRVVIESGLGREDRYVVDARGLSAGETVTILE